MFGKKKNKKKTSELKQEIVDLNVMKEKIIIKKEAIELYNQIIGEILVNGSSSKTSYNNRLISIVARLLIDEGFAVLTRPPLNSDHPFELYVSVEKEINDEILRNAEFYKSIKSAVKEMRPNK